MNSTAILRDRESKLKKRQETIKYHEETGAQKRTGKFDDCRHGGLRGPKDNVDNSLDERKTNRRRQKSLPKSAESVKLSKPQHNPETTPKQPNTIQRKLGLP